MPTAAAFFDLDKTIIAKSSTLAFSRPFYQSGLINRRAVLRSTYAQLLYLLQGADEEQMDRMRDYLKQLCAGWEVEQVRQVVDEALHELIDPLIYAEALELIDAHHEAGRDVVLVSSSGAEIVGPVGDMLGADHVIATRMVVADGRYTGDIDFYAYGPHKAEAVRELAAERGYDLDESYAYTDSVTDLPLLLTVGHPVVVNPDRALRREALSREWPVRAFARPVRLRDRVAVIPAPAAPVAGAAVGAGVVAGIWWAARRARRAGLGA